LREGDDVVRDVQRRSKLEWRPVDLLENVASLLKTLDRRPTKLPVKLQDDQGPRFAENAGGPGQNERFGALHVDLQEIGWSAAQRLVEGRPGYNPRLPDDWRGIFTRGELFGERPLGGAAGARG
jgi:hypothetical protein